MKKFLLSLMLLACFHFAKSQPQHFPDLHPDSVMRQSPQMSQMDFEPGELLIRFKDDVEVNIFKSDGKAQTGMATIDAIFTSFEVLEAKQLIPGAKKLQEKQMLRSFNGVEFERPSLHNIYLLKLASNDYSMFELMEALKEDKNVIYAEPNFHYYLSGAEPVSPPMNEKEMLDWLVNNPDVIPNHNKSGGYVPNDPLYSQQWGIPATQVDQVWNTNTGSSNAVIAILDTGVDWNHPDLTSNIWINNDETVNGSDSDGNGFVDDIRGWDFINNDNNPMDDNSHGTHVAGIAAAVGDNGIGIAGVNWHARILPVKILQSSGRGNAATIVQGINYAAQNGATVINMSFGSYARSLAMEDALANAYATSVLVAAAGNDTKSIREMLFFPAALSYVLGIEATDQYGGRAYFSNFDHDGPVYSGYPELFNYELKAPGSAIISTIPNGGYRIYSGTSMASPLTAAAVSLYREVHPDQSQEMLWGNFINTLNNNIQLKNAIEVEPVPVLSIISHQLVDNLDGDGDGRPDAGETMELYVTVRNTWGQADNIKVALVLGEFEDPTVVQLITTQVNIGSISPYATRTNALPLVFKIDDNVADARDIVFKLTTWYGENQGIVEQELIINVENGIELTGIINQDLTLYPNKQYIVTENLVVNQGVILTIKPGTKLKLAANKSLVVAGTLNAIGKPDSLIWLTKRDNSTNWAQLSIGSNATINMNYSVIEYGGTYNSALRLLKINYGTSGYISNSIFQYNNGWFDSDWLPFKYNNLIKNFMIAVYIDSWTNVGIGLLRHAYDFTNNNIVGNKHESSNSTNAYALSVFNNPNGVNQIENCIFNNGTEGEFEKNINAGYSFGNFHIINLQPNYLGTTNIEKIKKGILDFDDQSNLSYMDVSNRQIQPSAKNHGIVWKVLVNGADAQDEFVEPVGVGPQRFDVYFNRAMDISYTPMVTFGVRAPYTQQAVNENASWSADSTIYTVYKTIQLFTGDGINRVRVAGARDPELFEIPIEDSRFEFLIDAAGSASTDFMATPGLGKVNLEWSHPEAVEDLIGYNLYRFTHITDTTFTSPVLLNPTLVLDTLYTDFEVQPGTKYYYYYKILRTNMAETDSSRIINSIPLTASMGDANGDFAVNILDITHIVAYILNNNPQPFIFAAADINQDGNINLLDIIGVVNIIMGGNKSIFISRPATVFLDTEKAEIETDGSLSGLQFQLVGKNIEELQLKNLPNGFEFIRMISGDTLTGLLFNMNNRTLPEGRIKLFDIALHPGTLDWGEVFGGNYLGKYIPVFTSEDALPVDHRYSFNVYPNPTSEHLVSDIQLPSKSEVQLKMFDMYGRSINLMDKAIIDSGRHQFRFDKQQLPSAKGLYILQIKIRPLDKNELPFRKEVKLMVM